MQSELQQPPRMARYAPAEMYKCSEPYETHGLSERLPRLPPSLFPSLLPSLVVASSPRPPPGLGEAGERNLPLPPLPTPLSLPARPLPPASPPTHPLAGSRLSPVSPPVAAPLPARPTPSGPATARRSRGETKTEGKKLQLGFRGSALGRESWQAGCATRKAFSLPLFGPCAARFCCNLLRGRKRNERGRGDLGCSPAWVRGAGSRTVTGNRSAQEPERGSQGRRPQMCLDLNDTHLGNRESRELGLAWEGTAGPVTLGAPMPTASSRRCLLDSALGKQGAEKEGMGAGGACKTALENRGGPGLAVQAKETVGKLRCKGHFLASTTPAPSEVGFLGSTLGSAELAAG